MFQCFDVVTKSMSHDKNLGNDVIRPEIRRARYRTLLAQVHVRYVRYMYSADDHVSPAGNSNGNSNNNSDTWQ